MNMAKTAGFGTKDCLSLFCFGWNFFNSMRLNDDIRKYTYTEKHLRPFVRQSIKAGNVGVFSQYKRNEIQIKLLI